MSKREKKQGSRRSFPALAVVMTAVAGARPAQRLASLLVERHLAACVQCFPIRSTYRWKGRVERAAEQLLLIKTSARRAPEVVTFLKREHPYELPEILVLPVDRGLTGYAAWVLQETT